MIYKDILTSLEKLFLLFILLLIGANGYGQTASMEENIDKLLSRMTIQEKVGQLNQLDGRGIHGSIAELKVLVRKGEVGSLMNITDPKIVNELQSIAYKESNTGIPLIFARDVVHGFKTMLPIPLGQAATFHPDLIREGAKVAAIEATEHGIRWAFAPMIDISRDSRWGRIAESFGEDTFLTGEMATAVVKGYQGEDLADPQSMAACVKHFIGYGATEGGRDYNSTYIPERQLREVYMPPFRKAIDAGVASVMTSFNDNDGVPVSGNQYLLKNILRGEWLFDGVVVSDWGSVTEMIKHGFAKDRKHAAEIAVKAGLDVEMSSKSFIQHIEALIIEGTLSESILDDAVRNVLRLKYRLGLFENPYTDVLKSPKTYAEEHLNTAKKMAEESVVLLKNDNNTLPLSSQIKRILITGPLSDAPHDQMGTWTMDGDINMVRTPAKAIYDIYGKDIQVKFVPSLGYSRDKSQSKFEEVLQIADSVDAIIAFVGEEAILSGEAHSLAKLDLQGAQSELINVLKATGKPLVTVVMAGRPLAISKEIGQSDAVLYAWHPGTMGGVALAHILFGKTNPSGKLPVTFPKEVGQIPIYYNHKNTGRPAKGNEIPLDEIPVNAKQSVLGHSSYYLDLGSKPLYPFGYGLSYTTFEYSDLEISDSILSKTDTLSVKVKINNSGSYDGEEIVQLYITDIVGSVTRPVKELKSFKRISLKKGKEKVVVFDLPIADLAYWNIGLKKTVESGMFKLMVGTNSDTGIETHFEVK